MRLSQKLRKTTVRTRMTALTVCVLAFALCTLGLILRFTVEANLMSVVDHDLWIRGKGMDAWMAQLSRMGPMAFPRTQRSQFDPAAKPPPDDLAKYRPRTFSFSGRPFGPSSHDRPWDFGFAFQVAAHGSRAYSTVWRDGEELRVYSIPWTRHGRPTGVTQMVSSLTDMRRDVQGLTRTLLTLIPIALILSGIAAAFLTDRMLNPVRKITSTAASISSADLSQRLPVNGTDEFSRLSATFNAMLERLEDAFERQRRFTADASHELRTPLTAIKGHTSMALHGEATLGECQRALAGADRAASNMARIVSDLLLLARSDNGQMPIERTSIPVKELFEAAVEYLDAHEHPFVMIEVQPTLSVAGDRMHLTRVMTNLLENASRHTPRNGRILITASPEDEIVKIVVSDTGSGIAAKHLPHLFERFYRIDGARARRSGGTGLGLSICKSIVDAHGGSIEVQSLEGEGTTLMVRLPRAAFVPTETLTDLSLNAPPAYEPSL